MTEALPWLRLYTEIVDDPKIRLLAFEDRWHFVAIMCLKRMGILDKAIDESQMRRHVAVKLGVDMRTLDEIERRLVAEDLIEPGTLQPLQWDKRQFRSDGDPTNADRQARHRARQRQQGGQDAGEVPARGKHEYTPEFEQAWELYPKRPGANKLDSFKAWKARLASGCDAGEMIAGTNRYAAYCRAMKTESNFIKQPSTFFGPSEHFKGAWEPPLTKVKPAVGSERNAAWTAEMTGRSQAPSGDDGCIDVESRRVA